jgi:hypothetical protein
MALKKPHDTKTGLEKLRVKPFPGIWGIEMVIRITYTNHS